ADEADQLLHGFFVGLPYFFGRCQLRLTHNADFRIATRPGDEGCGPMTEEIGVIERTVLLVVAGESAFDLIFAHVIAVKMEIERCFELTSMGYATREL